LNKKDTFMGTSGPSHASTNRYLGAGSAALPRPGPNTSFTMRIILPVNATRFSPNLSSNNAMLVSNALRISSPFDSPSAAGSSSFFWSGCDLVPAFFSCFAVSRPGQQSRLGFALAGGGLIAENPASEGDNGRRG